MAMGFAMDMDLKFVNNVTKREYTTFSPFFSSFNYYALTDVKLPEGMDDGEYTLCVFKGAECIYTGLCRIGDYKAEKTEYKAKKEGIKQYNG